MNPYPGPRSVVIMDNCAIHHDEDIQHLIKVERGMFVSTFICPLFLIQLQAQNLSIYHHTPPTTTSIKAWLQHHEAQAVAPEGWPWLIHQARLAITDKMAIGWIANCGYSFSDEIN